MLRRNCSSGLADRCGRGRGRHARRRRSCRPGAVAATSLTWPTAGDFRPATAGLHMTQGHTPHPAGRCLKMKSRSPHLRRANISSDSKHGAGGWTSGIRNAVRRHGRRGEPSSGLARTRLSLMTTRRARTFCYGSPCRRGDAQRPPTRLPFNIRLAVGGGSPTSASNSSDPKQSRLENRGAYLAEGQPARQCHTVRTPWAGRAGQLYAGSPTSRPCRFAPTITANPIRDRRWTRAISPRCFPRHGPLLHEPEGAQRAATPPSCRATLNALGPTSHDPSQGGHARKDARVRLVSLWED